MNLEDLKERDSVEVDGMTEKEIKVQDDPEATLDLVGETTEWDIQAQDKPEVNQDSLDSEVRAMTMDA